MGVGLVPGYSSFLLPVVVGCRRDQKCDLGTYLSSSGTSAYLCLLWSVSLHLSRAYLWQLEPPLSLLDINVRANMELWFMSMLEQAVKSAQCQWFIKHWSLVCANVKWNIVFQSVQYACLVKYDTPLCGLRLFIFLWILPCHVPTVTLSTTTTATTTTTTTTTESTSEM